MKKKNFHFKKILWIIFEIIIFGGLIFGLSLLITQINILLSWLFLLIFYLINVLFAFIIYSQKRQTNAKLSWVYLILIFPIIGHIIFLTFGLIFVNRYEIKTQHDTEYQYETYFQKQATLADNDTRALSVLNKKNFLSANFQFYSEGYHFYHELIDALSQAQKSIFIISYIIKRSEITTEFMQLIKDKLAKGVKVYWLVDDFGVMPSQKKELRKLKKLGAQIFIIGKIHYPFINAASFSRNHQKFIVIDNKIVYSGGNNISDEYASLSKKYGHWIDLNYKITGEYVNEYNLWFMRFWNIVTKQKLDIKNFLNYDFNTENNSKSLLVIDSPSYNYSTSEFNWLKLFGDARCEIKIATPYFAISNSLEKQIILALQSGVKITVYIPGLPDKKFVYKVTLNQLNYLIKYGLEVKVYKGSFLHTKAGIVDYKYAWVGTNNMDSRSMFSQYETMDLFYGESVVDLAKIFEIYDRNCVDFKTLYDLEKNGTSFGNFLANWTKPLI
ncbi:phospholipase D-like domain-containing protein [Mycoplasma buteonis]|uniref:phospholipase D-like domain-containing protein n=1 Tax=Mycoplasma buteonis TaxID=171280 RepID=UPI00055AE8C8|nr:phospholipase D-like domain-containing protein [Mycoplasma buteonis]